MGQEVWDAYLNALKRYASNPGFVDIWEAIKNNYPASFRRYINSTALPKT